MRQGEARELGGEQVKIKSHLGFPLESSFDLLCHRILTFITTRSVPQTPPQASQSSKLFHSSFNNSFSDLVKSHKKYNKVVTRQLSELAVNKQP